MTSLIPPGTGAAPWPENARGPGSYQLVIRLRARRQIAVGALGEFLFPAGTYVYTGSALTGLRARVSRHLGEHKTCYWHIDYLLADPRVRLMTVFLFPGKRRRECALNRRVQSLPEARVIVPRFGCGDCRRGCPSHLFHFSDPPAEYTLQSAAHRIILLPTSPGDRLRPRRYSFFVGPGPADYRSGRTS